MKIKYYDKIYEVVNAIKSNGYIQYVIEDEPGHYDIICNISEDDIVDSSPIKQYAKNKYKVNMLDKEIDETRNKLSDLYDKKAALTRELKFDNIQIGRMYKFYDPGIDHECVNYGVITGISYSEDTRSWTITYAGIYNYLVHDACMFEDCQWAGFNACAEVIIHCHEEDEFIKNCTPINKYEYFQAVDEMYFNIMERSEYWLANKEVVAVEAAYCE